MRRLPRGSGRDGRMFGLELVESRRARMLSARVEEEELCLLEVEVKVEVVALSSPCAEDP